jgi:hypothetical protein
MAILTNHLHRGAGVARVDTGIDTGMVSTACIDYKIFRMARTLSSPGLLSDGVGHPGSLEMNVL